MKNLIADNLIRIRKEKRYSQRGLAKALQELGYDIDKNVITRIETQKRGVSDIELVAFAKVLDISISELLDSSDDSELPTT